MGHEWKIGDWAEYRGARYLVVKAWSRGDCQFVNAYSGSGAVRTFSIGASNIKHLPECTGWDWEPSKPVEPIARKWEFGVNPIEPPPGYRIITDGVVSDGDMSLQDHGWYYSTAQGKDIAELLDLGAAKAYARKIEEPKLVESPCSITDMDSAKAKSDVVGVGLVLIPWYSILAIGKIFIEGLRYGRDNWKNGVGDKTYQEERLEHAMLHLLKWKEGDRSEAHLAKVAWFCVTQLELERLEEDKRG